ncbi:MAG TPA: site-specific integrase [Gemmatimonadaceae bacterium]
MTLTKGANGIYRGLFRRKGLRPLHLSMRTKRAAEAKDRYAAMRVAVRTAAPEFLAQVRAGDVTVERVTAMHQANEPFTPMAMRLLIDDTPDRNPWGTVDAEADRYLKALPSRRRRGKTVTIAGFQLKGFVDFVVDGIRMGDRNVVDVTATMVLTYQQSLVDAGRPANTIATYMPRVGALYRWLIAEEQRAARDEKRDIRPLTSPYDPERILTETTRRDRVLTVAEAERLWTATPESLQWIVGCGLLAGLRIEEALHLRPGLDVDLVEGTINIRKQADWRPKTKRSVRMVPMSPMLGAAAQRHAARWSSSTWMVPSPVYADRPLTQLGFRRHFKQIVARAGMTYGRDFAHGVTFHTLRHTFASHAVMRGVDLYTVAKLLGDSLKMVEDVYADLSPDVKRAAVKQLAGAFALSIDDTPTDTGVTHNDET